MKLVVERILRLAISVVAAVLLAAGPSGCSPEAPRDRQAASTNQSAPSGPAISEPPEPWISKPPVSWPQIVLTNDASFSGHTPLQGASSFLIQTRKGRTFAATAKHLIGKFGGVKPTVSLTDFDSVLRTWKMFPRTVPQASVDIEALAIDDGLDWQKRDWLVLKLKQGGDRLPAQPLHVRPNPVAIGEKVYLIGCPYTERDCKQNVYRGTVTARRLPDRFRYDLDPPVELPGFSGAPIIDEKGYLVGVMTVWFQPKMDGKKYLEGGGEDAATLYSQLEGQ